MAPISGPGNIINLQVIQLQPGPFALLLGGWQGGVPHTGLITSWTKSPEVKSHRQKKIIQNNVALYS